MGWQKRLLNLPQVELLELRARLGFETPIHTPKPTIEQCLTPAERCRSDKFREMCKMQADPSKPWLADINQNQGWTTTGPAVPTVTRNMILYEYNHDHLMTSAEMLLSQGHPVMSHGPGAQVGDLPDGHGRLAWRTAFDQPSRKELTALVGNGQHLASTGAFCLWVLSNLVHVEDLDFKFDCVGEHRLAAAIIDVPDSPKTEEAVALCIEIEDDAEP